MMIDISLRNETTLDAIFSIYNSVNRNEKSTWAKFMVTATEIAGRTYLDARQVDGNYIFDGYDEYSSFIFSYEVLQNVEFGQGELGAPVFALRLRTFDLPYNSTTENKYSKQDDIRAFIARGELKGEISKGDEATITASTAELRAFVAAQPEIFSKKLHFIRFGSFHQ